jgi:hypothetical protein
MEPKLSPEDPDPDPPGFPPTLQPNTDEPAPHAYPIVDPDNPVKQRLRASRLMASATVGVVVLFMSACQTQEQRDAERQRERQDPKSTAYKAGEAARRLATEAERASAAAARKLDDSARKAREGWREQERKDQGRKDRERADH